MYTYTTAKTLEEKQAVLALIKKIYRREGYIAENDASSAFDPYIMSDTAKVFTGFVADTLCSTISVVADSDAGLPMDVLYKDEIETLRAKRKKIAEVTQFAVDHELLEKNDTASSMNTRFTASLPLLSLVLHYGLFKDLDYLCIAVHYYKHNEFYKRLGFVEIGGLKYYPSVNNTPAVAQMLDLRALRENKDSSGVLARFLEEPVDYALFSE